ncbi:hypothetical protein GMRT_11905 [Giardia muris]|uniref:Uncharacterized protein n=1 Tax=Giardia muris TaxID=5742 RepID=A0A4Z1SYD5_GIAMU|nr:hypothetical protein GMRT_11905 [Giardia muris]|eukprot:TNJ28518.1 hypothetical protein GMRT_11905 [Giardia muris]
MPSSPSRSKSASLLFTDRVPTEGEHGIPGLCCCWEVRTDALGRRMRLRALPIPLMTDEFSIIRGVASALLHPDETLQGLSELPLKTLPFTSRPLSLSPSSRANLVTPTRRAQSYGTPRRREQSSEPPDIAQMADWYAQRHVTRR